MSETQPTHEYIGLKHSKAKEQNGRPRGLFSIAVKAATLAAMVLAGGCLPNHSAKVNTQLARDIRQAEQLNRDVDVNRRKVEEQIRLVKGSIRSVICDLESIISMLDPNHPGDKKIRKELEERLAKLKEKLGENGKCR